MNFIHQGFWLRVCMCAYTHVCESMCVHCVCMCAHVYACVYMWVCMCVCMHKFLCLLVTFLVIVVKLLISLWGVSCT